jgi:putative transposase
LGSAYSEDLRECVVSYVEGGGRKEAAAELYEVGRDTVYRWLKQKAAEGSLAPKERKARGDYKLKEAVLEAYLEQQADGTLEEMGAALGVHKTMVHYACKVYTTHYPSYGLSSL